MTAAWEYRTLQIGVSTHDPRPGGAVEHPVNRRLQSLGAEGWELISTALMSDPAFVLLFFRRQAGDGDTELAGLRAHESANGVAAAEPLASR